MQPTILRTSNGKLDDADRPALDALSAHLAANPGTRILLHLHGGLVDQAAGEAVAAALSGAGALAYEPPADYVQVYVVWRTGMFETLRANWRDLFENDRLYRALLKKLLGYVSSKVLTGDGDNRSAGLAAGLSPIEIDQRLAAGGDAPFEDIDRLAGVDPGSRGPRVAALDDRAIEAEFAIALQQSREFSAAVEDFAAAIGGQETGRSVSAGRGDPVRGRRSLDRIDNSIRDELASAPEESAGRGLLVSASLLKKLVKHGASIAKRVIGRLRSGRGHGVHATIVEEILRELYGDLIGGAIWGMMKRDADDHFTPGKLGDELATLIAAGNHRLLAVGHSAGSIWLSAMLEAAAKRPSFPHMKIILLAPAVRMEKFAGAIAVGSSLIEGFRIFSMSDELERRDAVLGPGTGAIYPSSLLYLVSGLFEEEGSNAAVDAPLLGMQRFLGPDPAWISDPAQRAAIADVQGFLGGIANSTIYSKADGGAGLSTDATTHGGFDDNALTIASVRAFF